MQSFKKTVQQVPALSDNKIEFKVNLPPINLWVVTPTFYLKDHYES